MVKGGMPLGLHLAGLTAICLGQASRHASGKVTSDLRRIEALAAVAITWLSVALIGAIPYTWAGLPLIDSFFESMSGFTTTGATILSDFSILGRGLLFWRSLTQWLGGMGVLILFVAILPRLAIGMRKFFFDQVLASTDERLTPHIRRTASILWRLYAALTLLEAVALRIAGMPLYDAVCHSMTTLAAGGFSPNPESIMGYQNPALEWIICSFMFLAGANFALQYLTLHGRIKALFGNDEFRAYTSIGILSALLITLFIWQNTEGDFFSALRQGLFQALSILTTTGYASADYTQWNDQAQMILLLLMFVGGCAGSAAGGPKVLRYLLISRYTLLELRRTLHPRAILSVKLGTKVVPDDVMRTVIVFFLFYSLRLPCT